ncbi:MAG TPA: dicarboxylate/amino acid:cation symporter [Xanthobacteraceae bacterium]|nr:dicarboxylate/amino acid:cation symporter [Xanthobacteraceae bacterium]
MEAVAPRPVAAPPPRHPWYTILYVQVLIAIAAGVLIGYLDPHLGVQLKPLGDGFIALIKMMIAPVIFCTIVHGIASMGDLKKVGRVGVKTLFYFEAVSTLALVIGLVVARVLEPGRGFNIDPATLDPNAVATYVTRAKEEGIVAHLLSIIPNTFVGAFSGGDLLQVLLVSILTGFAISLMGEAGAPVVRGINVAARVFFSIIRIVVKAAPVGAFGAMAFTIGSQGIGALVKLGELILTFYFTSALFVLLVLGSIAYLAGFSILRFIAYIKDELLIVLGTSSSETVLPHMIAKMEHLGASKSVVGLVIPTGYSFNLDGTNIYMTLATLFLAQATNTPLTIWQELGILAIAMITSKGASGVTGAGFVTLAATLAIVPDIPIQSLALLLGIDKFMSECRALTNLIGNGVATIVISRWEGELDVDALHETMAHPITVGEEMERLPA